MIERREGRAAASTCVAEMGRPLRWTLRRGWQALERTAELRRTAAGLLLDHLLAELPPGLGGTDLLVETTLGALRSVLADDLVLKSEGRDPNKLLERGLLWLTNRR